MKQKIIGLVLLCLLSQPVNAAFGGFRLGGLVGAQLMQGRHWYTNGTPAQDMVKRLSAFGSIYGGHLGYLIELNSKIVVGFDAYIMMPGATPSIDLRPQQGTAGGPIEGTVSINHSRSIGAVLTAGMMFNPKVMVYFNAGAELAKYQFIYDLKVIGLPARQILNHLFKPIVIGLGFTYKFSPHFLVGMELSSPFFKRFKGSTKLPRFFSYKPVERRLVLKLSYLF